MSLTSKIVLWTACGFSAGIIGYVQYKQLDDRQKLHDGVLRDVERQQRRKIENLYHLEKQKEISTMLKNQQSHDDAIAAKLFEDSKVKNNKG